MLNRSVAIYLYTWLQTSANPGGCLNNQNLPKTLTLFRQAPIIWLPPPVIGSLIYEKRFYKKSQFWFCRAQRYVLSDRNIVFKNVVSSTFIYLSTQTDTDTRIHIVMIKMRGYIILCHSGHSYFNFFQVWVEYIFYSIVGFHVQLYSSPVNYFLFWYNVQKTYVTNSSQEISHII